MDKKFEEYKDFCKRNGLKPSHATSLDKFKKYLASKGIFNF